MYTDMHSERLYSTARWQRIWKYQLIEHPLCKFCAERGLVTPATGLRSYRARIAVMSTNLAWSFSELVSLCHDSAKRQLEERGYRLDVGLDGAPA